MWQWLLHLVAFAVVLVWPGKLVAIGVAYVDKLSLAATLPTTFALYFGYAWLILAGGRLLHRHIFSRFQRVNQLLEEADAKGGDWGWKRVTIVLFVMVLVPFIGLWTATSLAYACRRRWVMRTAAVIAASNVVFMLAAQCLVAKMATPPSWLPQVSEAITYGALPSAVISCLLYRYHRPLRRLGLRIAIAFWVITSQST